jgi:hypothetical protein
MGKYRVYREKVTFVYSHHNKAQIKMPPGFRWHLKIFCSEVQGFSLKIVGFLWWFFRWIWIIRFLLVYWIFWFLWIWIIDIVKVYIASPLRNLRLPNRLKRVSNKKKKSLTGKN